MRTAKNAEYRPYLLSAVPKPLTPSEMEYELRDKKVSNPAISETIEIVYNGKVYGEWEKDANIDYPEDLTLSRDLSELIEIGIKIGKQMERDSKQNL